jgi:hypothetical protein
MPSSITSHIYNRKRRRNKTYSNSFLLTEFLMVLCACSLDFKVPLAEKGELQLKHFADEQWNRKVQIQIKKPGKDDKLEKWNCSYGHSAKDGSSFSAELGRKLDLFHYLQLRASLHKRKLKLAFDFRAPD